jgi:AcrR family transcriptional regulator
VRRSGEEAREHILRTAQTEFARYGMSGARIDRIATQAGASKERLYAYFGDKQGLFAEVVHRAVRRVHTAVRIEDEDLVAYAGRLVAHFFAHPDDLRLLSWTRLDEQCERALAPENTTADETTNVDAIRRAQHAGLVDDSWAPEELLRLIRLTATYWAGATEPNPASLPHCRAVVEEAVRRLIEPQRHADQR